MAYESYLWAWAFRLSTTQGLHVAGEAQARARRILGRAFLVRTLEMIYLVFFFDDLFARFPFTGVDTGGVSSGSGSGSLIGEGDPG